MSGADRRRVERHALDVPGEIRLAGERTCAVRIVNLGQLGALVAMSDLEDAVLEGARVLLTHPVLEDERPTEEIARTAGVVVRVELDFSGSAVQRQLAVYFDGGAAP